MSLDASLLELIRDYLAKVHEACDLMRRRWGTSRGNIPKRNPDGLQRGILDDERNITYRYHGCGCCVSFDGLVVDFDFDLQEQRRYFFDAWRLYRFAATSLPAREPFTNLELVEEHLACLIRDSIVCRQTEPVSGMPFYVSDYVNRKIQPYA